MIKLPKAITNLKVDMNKEPLSSVQRFILLMSIVAILGTMAIIYTARHA